jgi:O-antigen ligase/tetratricopeptide (TPR) repeat protein
MDSRVASPPETASLWIEIRRAVWVFLGFAGVAVLLSSGHFLSLVLPQVVFGLQAFAVLILGTWLAVAVLTPSARPNTPLFAPVLFGMAVYGVSALLSQRPRLSVESTLGGIGFGIAFLFLTRLLMDPWIRKRVATLFVCVVGAMAFAYIGQVVVNWVDWWGVIGKISIPPLRPSWAGLVFGSPNVMGSFLLLGGPIAVAMLPRITPRRAPVRILAALVIVALFLTGSRGAYLGAACASVTAVWLLLTRERSRSVLISIRVAIRDRRWLIPVGIALAAGYLALLPAVLYRFGTGGEGVRLDLWESALAIFAAHPLTGGGPGTWVQLKVEANPPGVPNNIFNNAHNMYVQAAAELGVIGLVAMVVLLIAVGRRLLAGRSAADHGLRFESVAVVAGLVAFAAQLTVENMIRLPAICFLLIFVVAWIDAGLPRPSMEPHGRRLRGWQRVVSGRWLYASTLIGIVGVVPTLVRIDLAANDSARGQYAILAEGWPTALAYYELAHRGDPEFTLYDVERAAAMARLGMTADAKAILESVVKIDPIAVNQIGLAALELELGNTSAALSRARLALSLGTGEPTIAINVGRIAEAVGDRSLAMESYADLLAWAPPLAADPFWDAAERTIPKAAIVEAARTRSTPSDAALISAYAGATVEARMELESLPATGTRDIYLAVTDWLGGDVVKAEATLAARVEANPLDWTSAAWLSRIARLSGDPNTAYRYARWAVAVQGDTAPSVLFEDAIAASSSEAAQNAGLPGGYPSSVYLRTTTPFLLMPQLTLVGVR